MIVSFPPFFGPLKRVIGEPTLIASLFRERHHCAAKAFADDRRAAGLAGGGHVGGDEFAFGADGEPGRVEGAVFVEFEHEFVEDRGQFAASGSRGCRHRAS